MDIHVDSEGVERVEAGLHPCAAEFPVPERVQVVETASRSAERGRHPTCVIDMVSQLAPQEAARVWRETLDEAGWTYQVDEDEPYRVFLRLTGPKCGLAMAIEQEAGDVPTTTVVVSLMPCDVVEGR